jgi:hypothetical protein
LNLKYKDGSQDTRAIPKQEDLPDWQDISAITKEKLD